jgi:hypothetical protein
MSPSVRGRALADINRSLAVPRRPNRIGFDSQFQYWAINLESDDQSPSSRLSARLIEIQVIMDDIVKGSSESSDLMDLFQSASDRDYSTRRLQEIESRIGAEGLDCGKLTLSTNSTLLL